MLGGCQPVPLVDADAEDAGERGQFTVVRAVDEELLDIGHGVAEICHGHSSPISTCRQHPLYFVMVDLLSGQRRMRVRVLRLEVILC